MGLDLYTVNVAHAQCQCFAMHCGLDTFIPTSCTLKYTQSRVDVYLCFSSKVILTPGNIDEDILLSQCKIPIKII